MNSLKCKTISLYSRNDLVQLAEVKIRNFEVTNFPRKRFIRTLIITLRSHTFTTTFKSASSIFSVDLRQYKGPQLGVGLLKIVVGLSTGWRARQTFPVTPKHFPSPSPSPSCGLLNLTIKTFCVALI